MSMTSTMPTREDGLIQDTLANQGKARIEIDSPEFYKQQAILALETKAFRRLKPLSPAHFAATAINVFYPRVEGENDDDRIANAAALAGEIFEELHAYSDKALWCGFYTARDAIADAGEILIEQIKGNTASQ